ncbi:MAG: hypothetical protein QME71_06845 [Dehalococcoidia bacterium]|nr:hypothetical protein [Dehalococcoidia bacterium]
MQTRIVFRPRRSAVTLEAILAGLERLVFAASGDHSRRSRWVRKAVVRASLDGGGFWELPVAFRGGAGRPPRRLVRRAERH